MNWKRKTLQRLCEMEQENKWLYTRAEKYGYFLPRGFLRSIVNCGEQIRKLKAAVSDGVIYQATD